MEIQIRTFRKTGKIAHAKEREVAGPELISLSMTNVYKVEKYFDLLNHFVGVLSWPLRTRSCVFFTWHCVSFTCIVSARFVATPFKSRSISRPIFVTRASKNNASHWYYSTSKSTIWSSGIPTTGFIYRDMYIHVYGIIKLLFQNQPLEALNRQELLI